MTNVVDIGVPSEAHTPKCYILLIPQRLTVGADRQAVGVAGMGTRRESSRPRRDRDETFVALET